MTTRAKIASQKVPKMPSVLLIGGVRSGKSSGATRLVQSSAVPTDRVAVVVFGIVGVDGEFDSRITRHQLERPTSWDAIEVSLGDDWVSCVSDYDAVIVDCVGTMLSQFVAPVTAPGAQTKTPTQEDVASWAISQFDSLLSSPAHVVIVTNEVGLGLVSEYPIGRVFTDSMGHMNRWLADKCDRTFLYVAGIPVDLHRIESEPSWSARGE